VILGPIPGRGRSAFARISVVVAAVVLYVVLTWVAFVITLLVGAGFELTLPSFPWWATIFWWIGFAVAVWFVAFRLASRCFAKALLGDLHPVQRLAQHPPMIHIRSQLAPLKKGEPPRRVKLKSRASARSVVLLERATEALLDQLRSEQEKGFGHAEDFVFTTGAGTGRPYCRNRISSKGIGQAARKAGLGKVGAQVLRRSAATLRAYAGVPKHVAAREMGHTPSVFERSYAKAYGDAQDMEETRTRLSSIGFGVRSVDQPLTNEG
jgi:hypothetical protein